MSVQGQRRPSHVLYRLALPCLVKLVPLMTSPVVEDQLPKFAQSEHYRFRRIAGEWVVCPSPH